MNKYENIIRRGCRSASNALKTRCRRAPDQVTYEEIQRKGGRVVLGQVGACKRELVLSCQS